MSVIWTRKNKKSYCQCMLFGKKRIIFLNISVNKIKVKDEKNKTKDEEPSITDNSVINAPIDFKLFKWGKNFLNKLDTTCK